MAEPVSFGVHTVLGLDQDQGLGQRVPATGLETAQQEVTAWAITVGGMGPARRTQELPYGPKTPEGNPLAMAASPWDPEAALVGRCALMATAVRRNYLPGN